jgi:hypothetical protein
VEIRIEGRIADDEGCGRADGRVGGRLEQERRRRQIRDDVRYTEGRAGEWQDVEGEAVEAAVRHDDDARARL